MNCYLFLPVTSNGQINSLVLIAWSNRKMHKAVILEMAISEYAMYVCMYVLLYGDHAC